MSISRGDSGTLFGLDQPERVERLRTSSSLFHLLGAKPVHGRLLCRKMTSPAGRKCRSQPRLLAADLQRRSRRRRQEHHAQRLRRRRWRRQESVHGCRRARPIPVERRDDADRREHPADGHYLPLPFGADAVTRRGDENYNLHGTVEAGRHHGAGAGRRRTIAARIRDKDKRDRTFTISVVPLLEQVVGNVRRSLLVLSGRSRSCC